MKKKPPFRPFFDALTIGLGLSLSLVSLPSHADNPPAQHKHKFSSAAGERSNAEQQRRKKPIAASQTDAAGEKKVYRSKKLRIHKRGDEQRELSPHERRERKQHKQD